MPFSEFCEISEVTFFTKKSMKRSFQKDYFRQILIEYEILLTHFSPVSHFYTPWKCQKTFGFLTFSGGIEMWHWT